MTELHAQAAVLSLLLRGGCEACRMNRAGLVGLLTGILLLLTGGELAPSSAFTGGGSLWADEAPAKSEADSQPSSAITPEVRNQIADAVNREIDANLFPGVVLLIGNETGVLYHAAFGAAQVEPEVVPMRRDSLFDIASVTKVVCAATAIGMLRDRGLIDPDARFTEYLPDYTGKGVEEITLRHLAGHISGFPDSPRVSYGGKYRGDAVFVKLLQESPRWPVESQYHYSCRNIILLSTIVERVSGKSFEEFCQQEIFDPLQMRDSAFNRIPPSSRVVATHHPVLGENHNADGRDAGRAVGNAGLFTSAADLAHFCEMMLHEGEWRGVRLLSAETIADFTTHVVNPQFAKRAFVWEVDPASRHRPRTMSDRAYGHSGNTGISIWIDPDPASRCYAIVMTNRNHPRLPNTASGKEPTNSKRGIEQYRARGRIADAALLALELTTE